MRAICALQLLLLQSLFFAPCSAAWVLTADHRVGSNQINSGVDGSCNGNTFSAASGQFTSADVGKWLVVTDDRRDLAAGNTGSSPDEQGKYTFGKPSFSKIEVVSSPTTVTLKTPCTGPSDQTARWDIGSDNTTDLRECLSVPGSATCVVPPGNYMVLSHVHIPSLRTLSCQPGAVFFFPRHDNNETHPAAGDDLVPGPGGFLEMIDTSGATVTGCTIVGTNIHEVFDLNSQGNWAIMIWGDSHGNQITNNTVRNGWSDGDILISGHQAPSPFPTQNMISGNSLSDCGYNGISLIVGTDNVITDNRLVDCSLVVEPWETRADSIGRNVIYGNKLTRSTRPVDFTIAPEGERHYMQFNSCGDEGPAAHCPGSGASTVRVRDNTFIGTVRLFARCTDGVLGQEWSLNATALATGEPCTLNQANCAYKTDTCTPSIGRPFIEELLGVLNSAALSASDRAAAMAATYNLW